MGMLNRNAEQRRRLSAALAIAVGASLPSAGFIGTYLAVMPGLLLADLIRAFGFPFLDVVATGLLFSSTYLSGGALAGFLALSFIASRVRSEFKKNGQSRMAATGWIVLCAMLPVLAINVTWWQDRNTAVYLRNAAVFFLYGGAMATCLAVYVCSRSATRVSNWIHVGIAGGVALSLLSPVLGIYGDGFWRILLCSSCLSAAWGGCVTYLLLRPKTTTAAPQSSGSMGRDGFEAENRPL